MKTKNLFTRLGVASREAWACLAVASRRRVLPALIAVLNLIPAGRVTAQTFMTLYSFTARPFPAGGNNSDGANPSAGLIVSGNTLYGTAGVGGSGGFGNGTVFAVNTDGTGFTNLHSFAGDSDGAGPWAGLVLSGNTLYGTAVGGGSSGAGTVFAVNTDGTGFTNLHSFTALSVASVGTNSDGANPRAGLILSGNTLYGTAGYGGASGAGTVFAVNTDGAGFTTLHSFTAISGPNNTNSDGADPFAGLILSGNTLYGTAAYGGSGGVGTVYAVKTDGTGFTNLHSFTALDLFASPATNSDGAYPSAGLILSGNTLYGTAGTGGSLGAGTVFAVNTNGTGFTTLHSFTAGTPSCCYTDFFGYVRCDCVINSDGARLDAGLILSGNTLYGTTYGGGSSGQGTVFAVNTNGTGFTNLHSFTATSGSYPAPHVNSDGVNPLANLLLSGNTLYGTATGGGSGGVGTVFSLSFRPQLTITPSGSNVILSWPANVAGFDYTGYTLQSATNLGSPVWSTNSPAPVIIGGQNTVTNPISVAQQFYRLVQ